ncbi:MAG: GntR family transcriptional regulator [Bacteroides sp.]|nr:GntR family transcriptional regulator [Bacteroides sp.]
MLLTINLRDKRPIYKQIVSGIQDMVLSGELKPDEQLPSVRQLATDMSINPNTIAKAYAELERSDVLYSAAGRGYFVNPDLSDAYRAKEEEVRDTLIGCIESAKRCGIKKERIFKIIDGIYDDSVG